MSASMGNVVTMTSQTNARSETHNRSTAGSPRAEPKSIVALTLSELFDRDLPPAEEIISPWLRGQSLNMIHAWRGVGKSHIALGIAYAAATGGKFLQWHASKPVRVLYIDGEMQGSDLKSRLLAIDAANGKTDPSLIDNLRIITPDVQVGRMLDIADPEWQATLDEVIGEASLIVVDNLSCLARSGGKENDSDSWEPLLEWGLRMRREGRAVIFVHHSGKNGLQRGTSRREDSLNIVINLRHPPEYSPESGALFQVHFEKGRELFGENAKPFEAQLITNQDGPQCWLTKPIDESIYEKVIEKANLNLTNNEIAEELGINKSTVSRHKKAAIASGRIKKPKVNPT